MKRFELLEDGVSLCRFYDNEKETELEDIEIVDLLNHYMEYSKRLEKLLLQKPMDKFSEEIIDRLKLAVEKYDEDFYVNFFTKFDSKDIFLTVDFSKSLCAYGDGFLSFISKKGNGASMVNLSEIACMEIVPK